MSNSAPVVMPVVVEVVVSWVMAPFRLIADQPKVLFPLSVMLYVLAQTGMIQLVRRLENFPPDGHRIPDVRWQGYTVSELNNYYDTLGYEGCRIYKQVANWDFFPYMPGYILPLGALHVMAARQLRQTSDLDALALILVGVLDMVESFWHRRGCVLYMITMMTTMMGEQLQLHQQPQRLSDWQIQLASACVQLKFTVLILSVVQLLVKGVQIHRRQRAWKTRYHLPQFAAYHYSTTIQ
jgi:hypothetical protein